MTFEDRLKEKVKNNILNGEGKEYLGLSDKEGWLLRNILSPSGEVKDIFFCVDSNCKNLDIIAINFIFSLYWYFGWELNEMNNFESCFYYVRNSIEFHQCELKDNCLYIDNINEGIGFFIISPSARISVIEQIEKLNYYFNYSFIEKKT